LTGGEKACYFRDRTLAARVDEAMNVHCAIPQILPTRFGNARDHPLRSKFPKTNPGKAKSPNETAAPAALLTAINKPGGTGIPRELGETFIVAVRLQCGTDRGILLHRLLSPLVPLNPRLLRHSKLGNYRRDWKIQTRFS
jgi:hypothetical protein